MSSRFSSSRRLLGLFIIGLVTLCVLLATPLPRKVYRKVAQMAVDNDKPRIVREVEIKEVIREVEVRDPMPDKFVSYKSKL